MNDSQQIENAAQNGNSALPSGNQSKLFYVKPRARKSSCATERRKEIP
jgi:hypothetical protein